MAGARGRQIEKWKHETYGIEVPVILLPTGSFRASYGSETFEFDTLKEMRETLHKTVEESFRLNWTGVLEVQCNSNHSGTAKRQESQLDAGLDLKVNRYWIAKRADGSWMKCPHWDSVDAGQTRFDHETHGEMHGSKLNRLINSQVWWPPTGLSAFSLPHRQNPERHVGYRPPTTYLVYDESLWQALLVISNKLSELAGKIDTLLQSEEGRSQFMIATAGLTSVLSLGTGQE